MKTIIRTLILLLIVMWLGGVMFFPIVAATAFGTLSDTHAAGTVVAHCLRILHEEGLFAGAAIVVLLIAGQVTRALPRPGAASVVVTLIMLALTAFSQFWTIPQMEKDRIAVGGAIDDVPATNPYHADFNRRHALSEKTEEGVLLAGIVLVVLLCREPKTVRG
ncbi:DUF4149 domain-containing protein [Silvibacterium dinghuense]|uniref:DUF4149 domain-containing protein n=1 Tax=Silvibacterium dinghuense TaxID=1560006 RepID=A0A4Q1SET1_9BACT|nr:DUF4149 domain-containing protein [Silvibacterium dinghuense]RXS95591.1 DUF4149 domain-containing protein [Silvibacterium dinghuense]GGH14256.1 hypothetical protein GCM10011586_34600 [Silvibacterium dinghuense]